MLKHWKSYEKAFPDMECECLKGLTIPTRCSKCGADRTKDNWLPDVRCCDCALFNRCHQRGTEDQHKELITCDAFKTKSQNQSSSD